MSIPMDKTKCMPFFKEPARFKAVIDDNKPVEQVISFRYLEWTQKPQLSQRCLRDIIEKEPRNQDDS